MNIKNIKRAGELNDFLKHINWILEDINNGAEITSTSWNKYYEQDHCFIADEDKKTHKVVKEAVIEALNNRIKEINEEIKNL